MYLFSLLLITVRSFVVLVFARFDALHDVQRKLLLLLYYYNSTYIRYTWHYYSTVASNMDEGRGHCEASGIPSPPRPAPTRQIADTNNRQKQTTSTQGGDTARQTFGAKLNRSIPPVSTTYLYMYVYAAEVVSTIICQDGARWVFTATRQALLLLLALSTKAP